uniref:Annexin n=1 Tax=Lygus hesperus TaxID=30085 RepID=A0A146M595_LYGHE
MYSPLFHTRRRQCQPTVFPALNFNAKTDAEGLHEAMNRFGYNSEKLINIICHRDIEQRLKIVKEYKTLYGVGLEESLKSKLSGNMRKLVLALITPLPHFFAKELHDAMYGLGTTESVLIEILCTLTNLAIKYIVAAYEEMYGKSLESDLIADTSGHFRKLCVSLLQGNRDENPEVDINLAKSDANRLFDAGVARWGTDESVFNAILVSRSYHHLRQVFIEYYELTKHTIDHAIEEEFSGDIKKGHLAIVKCVRNKTAFYAERLYKSMKGLGTDDKSLIRIIVTRSEVDLWDIKSCFKDLYGGSLEKWITDDTSGDYRKALLAIVRE